MTVLQDYNQFNGLHWETGSVRNYYAYLGVKAPHTGQPYSEAMLLGVSGGIVMGYFSFAYKGYDPQARILTRNTFDPWDTMLGRLGVIQNVQHTTNPQKALHNLLDTLENRQPAIVWADMFSLPYNALPFDRGMWAMMPILVYSYDEQVDLVQVADRARLPLDLTTKELADARGRVKKYKYRLVTLAPPDPDKLPVAVRKGIWDCIKLFIEAPPKGTRKNFGLAAFNWWADLLVKPKQRMSWEKEFPAGVMMYSGLTSAFNDINIFGKDGRAERDVYADFLDEASLVLEKPGLRDVAMQFRQSAKAWEALSDALLPDQVPLFGKARRLMLHRHHLFLDQGQAALDEIREIDERLTGIRATMEVDFPLTGQRVQDFRQNLREYILAIRDIEQEAIEALQTIMA